MNLIRARDILFILAVVCGITLFGNWIAVKIDPIKALPGMLILGIISFVGWGLSKIIPANLPPIVYISLVAIILTTPWTPGSAWVLSQVNNVNFLALCTPILAYAGISIGKELDEFAKMSWRIAIVAMFVLAGSFLGSAIIAQIMLKITGKI
ncbi:MAG: DUF340 domain-containing protein [Candidatus Fermentithermobacillus carboniphilus]|uniref:DUF340 domain-containing protein n=1 Tax=Candidatus Fermentithermobacillus carboniphilus TaxID=3085328 RepID=A0AAT9LD79_9FIRM|nr:MAG: DUF340 domain-containing protein [Candidatus Fermentithermobacillus carboniphilus]